MKKIVKIDKVDNDIVTLRSGDKLKLRSSFDGPKIRRWSLFDEIELEAFGLDKGLTNITRKEHVKAEPV